MKVYTYTAKELEPIIGAIPSGTLRLEGPNVQAVKRADQADVIVVPATLSLFPTIESLARLPHWQGREARHCVLQVSDNPDEGDRTAGCYMYAGCPAMFLRCNVRPHMRAAAPNSIMLPWPVWQDDLDTALTVSATEFRFDVGFRGWISSPTRRGATEFCLREFGPRFDFVGYEDFYGYLKHGEEEQKRRRADFLRSLRECRVQLCPSSIDGVWPYRAWEAMATGHVAAVVCTGQEFPRADAIPYREIMVLIPAEDAHATGRYIRDFLSRTPDDRLMEIGKRARDLWMRYLDGRKWPQIHAEIVEQQARRMGLIREPA